MLLSDHEIAWHIKHNRIKIEPFEPGCVQPASYDCTLAPTFRVFNLAGRSHIDPTDKESLEDLTSEFVVPDGKKFPLYPGQFVLASTLEWFEFPRDIAGRIEGKSSLGRVGLNVHSTAGFFDPGFRGHATLELSNNLGAVLLLTPGMFIAQMSYLRLGTEAKHPYGSPQLKSQYQDQPGTAASQGVRVQPHTARAVTDVAPL